MKLKIILLFVILVAGVLVWSNFKSDKRIQEFHSEEVNVNNGDIYRLTASKIKKEINGKMLDMYAYNNSIPGPVIRVKQHSTINLEFVNNLPEETLLHSHGVRMDNKFDGTAIVQDPIKPGETFTYELKFPDSGVYWYHPHVREDRQQEMGLYGLFIVEPEEENYWTKVDREIPLVLDDILVSQDGLEFSDLADRVMMGRYGNQMMINGMERPSFEFSRGEIVRFYVLNAANVRPFRISIPGAKLKLVGGDSGIYERDSFVDELTISPSERYVVDVLLEDEGDYVLQHRGEGNPVVLSTIKVKKGSLARNDFYTLNSNSKASQEIRSVVNGGSNVDKEINLSVDLLMMMGHNNMQGMPCHRMPDGSMMGDCEGDDGIEWEDSMAMMNIMTNKNNVKWKVIDGETKFENENINWKLKVGDKVKVKIFNDPDSDHPMQHPIHFHGQRFVILSVDGVINTNMAWKDTVLVPTGKTVEILLDITNPGKWMAHCHIAEHLEGGMMLEYEVI